MQIDLLNVILIVAVSLWFFSIGYLFFALIAVEHFNYEKNKKTITKNFHPSITILKPICGLDPNMLDNLRSFCQQDYPQYQVIFGIQDEKDPALSIVKEITREFSKSDVSYIISTECHGANHKVSNLINMYPYAKHEYILIADSDMRVSKKFLTQVISPFNDTNIGAVTCLYNGIAKDKIPSKLNAMFINNWFLPSVLISRILQPMKYCLGATMIVKRNILKKIGGFESFSNYLADDYILGKLISNFGYKIYLSNYIVENIVEETSFKSLILHELRWARTLKRIEPLGYALTFLTDSFILSIFAGIILFITTENSILLYLPIVITLSLRVLLHNSTNKMINSKRVTEIWLIPLRDILSFFIRIVSYIGNSVRWRNNTFIVDHLGLMHGKKVVSSDVPKTTEKIPDLQTP